MTITAKYNGFCSSCRSAIRAGDRIEWAQGTRPVHAQCGTATKAPKAAKATKAAGTRVGQSVHIARYGERDASVIVGRTLRVSGALVTVVGAEVRYQSASDNEDMGDMQGGGWGATLWTRPATEAETAPILEREAAKAARHANADRLRTITDGMLRQGRRPEAEAEAYASAADAWRLQDGARIAVAGAVVSYWHPGYSDDYRAMLAVVDSEILATEIAWLRAELAQ